MKRNNDAGEVKESKEKEKETKEKDKSTGILRQCVEILKTDEVRKEMKKVFAPLGELILSELHPYVYIIFSLIGFFILFMIIILTLLVIILYKISFLPVILSSNLGNIIGTSISATLGDGLSINNNSIRARECIYYRRRGGSSCSSCSNSGNGSE